VSGTFRVDVTKDYLTFSSAHFITFRGHKCECLHGHNYTVAVAVEGGVDDEALFVLDFAVVKAIAKPIVDAIDHKVLLPTRNPKVAIRDRGERVEVDVFGEHRYLFPTRDVALVPVANTTVEMLAEWFAREMKAKLVEAGHGHLTLLEVRVEESPGQSATYRLPLP
jgi:6-pyruvoyltetrahydropterin/6-carboxytetrahydropterin synthase